MAMRNKRDTPKEEREPNQVGVVCACDRGGRILESIKLWRPHRIYPTCAVLCCAVCVCVCMQRVALMHNSLFVLGWETNLKWTHEIRRDRRRMELRRADEQREGGHRISLTFRNVATFMRPDGRAFGQGAVHKSEAELDAAISAGVPVPRAVVAPRDAVTGAPVAAPVLPTDGDAEGSRPVDAGAGAEATADAEAGTTAGEAADDAAAVSAEEEDCLNMLYAFGRENRDPKFDWDESYGAGFSVINMQIINPH